MLEKIRAKSRSRTDSLREKEEENRELDDGVGDAAAEENLEKRELMWNYYVNYADNPTNTYNFRIV
jgi:hypothetical protein